MKISRLPISLTENRVIVSEKVQTPCQKGSNITIFHQKRVFLKDFLQLKGLGEVYKCLNSTWDALFSLKRVLKLILKQN